MLPTWQVSQSWFCFDVMLSLTLQLINPTAKNARAVGVLQNDLSAHAFKQSPAFRSGVVSLLSGWQCVCLLAERVSQTFTSSSAA